jgi:hypothetical protein
LGYKVAPGPEPPDQLHNPQGVLQLHIMLLATARGAAGGAAAGGEG